ncbi:MAG: ATP-binding protein, partial [bacterium]|nr:ATP-binding protein [bacterium]
DKLRDAWLKWKTGLSGYDLKIKEMLSASRVRMQAAALGDSFDSTLSKAGREPLVAMEFLRQLCLCSRTSVDGKPLLDENLIIIVEEADMLLPEGELARLSGVDRRMTGLCAEWFSDPLFMNGRDAVVLLTESRSSINHRITRLPQVMSIDVPSPDEEARSHFIYWFNQRQPEDRKIHLWSSQLNLARLTGGLSIHALRQLLVRSCHLDKKVTPRDVIDHVQDFIRTQLGEDVVEFKRPEHTLKNVVGFSNLKNFLKEEFIPRLRSTGPDALPGAAVSGPIGGGKSFIFEAVAAEADMVVLVLKNIRSQWFGQTDVIFEKLRRVIDSLARVLIFVDEADTQFGGVGPGTHPTERRLTGKIQAMMADPRLRGKVKWLLMTARIHHLSPDIRRPGRVGDLIIPVLDPEGDDRKAFISWMVKPVLQDLLSEDEMARIAVPTEGYSAASFASVRSELIARLGKNSLGFEQVLEVIEDRVPPAITDTRRLQTLHALVNCTRKSLIPDSYLPDPGDFQAVKKK